jgi:CHAD domain-containing protein
MAFILQRGRGVGAEIRRLFDHQLGAALDALAAAPPEIGDARRRIKKARTLLRLARPALGPRYAAANRRLRKAGHSLGVLTDAAMVSETLEHLHGFDLRRLPPSSIDALRRVFAARVRQLSSTEAVTTRDRAVRLLERQRRELANTAFFACGVHSVVTAVRAAHRDARAARQKALTRPTTQAFHAWRRRTKHEWYLFRLIDAEVMGGAVDDQHRLEALDGRLGELHDVAVLLDHIRAYSPLPRSATAAALRAVRAYSFDLRRRLRRLVDVQDEPPRELEVRLLLLWLSGSPLEQPRGSNLWARRA